MKRREVLQRLAVAGTVLAPPLSSVAASASDKLGSVLPTRPLGNTGEKLTCLGLGGYHVGYAIDEATAQAIVERALESGIRFFDTAYAYQKGKSEERYGRYLIPKYRDQIFLMTKSGAGNAEQAREQIEGSLRRMNTDVIDLWQLHSLMSPEDTDGRLAAGVLEVALKAQEEGKIRYIGYTGHASPYALNRMQENKTALKNMVTCQLPINPVDAASKHSFIHETLPSLLEKKVGVLAMKTLADGRFFNFKDYQGREIWSSDNPVVPDAISMEECIAFALSLPIASLITGAEKPEYVDDKVAIVKRFSTMSEDDRKALINKVASFAEAGEVEYYKDKDLRAGTRKS